MFRIALYTPEIPPNTGNVIRLAANVGAELHLIRPLGFSLDERKVRRAGLDYRELADVRVHADADAFRRHVGSAPSVWAFTTSAQRPYTEVTYGPGDVLLFGPESVGLPDEELDRATGRVRLPMMPGSRSLNLANAVAVAVYEAWRQHGFAATGGSPARPA